jgi:amidase
MLDVMAGVTAGRPHRLPLPAQPFQELARQEPKRLRIQMMLHGPLVETLPEITAQVRRVADVLRSAGHTVDEVPAPGGTLEEFLPIYQKFVSLMPGVPWAKTQPVTAWLALAGKKLSMDFVAQRQASMTARLAAGFTGADAWLLPTVPVLPPAVGAWSAWSPEKIFSAAAELGSCTVAFNLLGYPAASLPMALASDGRPIGVQVAAPLGEEGRVLALSTQIERALPWSGRKASLG